MPPIPRKLPPLVQESNLIQAIRDDIVNLGVIGEKETAFLVYLTGTSRKLANPLRLMIRGRSSAGKSFVQQQVKLLFPLEDIIEATDLSSKAIFYGKPGWLVHKFVIKGERSLRNDAEARDATAPLRQLISENRVTQYVAPTGSGKDTQYHEQDGPIAFCETTTAENKDIFEEDRNRCIEVFMSEDQEQTDAIVMAKAVKYITKSGQGISKKQVIDRHRAFQSELHTIEVTIPYAPELARKIPTGCLEVRRVFQQILSTVEALVMLQQHVRTKDKSGRFVATLEDYEIAKQVLSPSLARLEKLSGTAKIVYEAMAKIGGECTTSQISNETKISNRSTLAKALKELSKIGTVKCLHVGRGITPSSWELTGVSPLKATLLPDLTGDYE